MLQGLHQTATAALDPTAEGGGFSTIPAASLTAMETCQVSILAGSTTLEPAAQVQVQHICLHLLESPSLNCVRTRHSQQLGKHSLLSLAILGYCQGQH